ncbi:MAG: hypothetical protein A2660_02765 [Candidatus Doudnabacteria bacterium RIFCSPHIGHO2_01_FULL_45_18]|uniref:Uncharacterized protein n=1 Tax=Candidatus Doudnabacteria bacterium RIFCSPHIGHO2_01_FULL_45_18 TaxID=1817823 RepID=A0A1F5NQY3_9BACT|nr:MAG: hypothetical protein A2660_02765 [Candidatus Doudnabacteria bacterium RIFCSPHIGHO2_01_FULL_45_18]
MAPGEKHFWAWESITQIGSQEKDCASRVEADGTDCIKKTPEKTAQKTKKKTILIQTRIL